MPLKVAVIGAGSLGFTRRLVQDILGVEELSDTVFALTDIDKRNLDMVTKLLKRDIKANKVPAKLESTMDRRKAVEGADYVMNVARVGGLEAFETDIEIPLRFKVDQCVGDTLAPGGIMYGQRSIAAILDFCEDIREVANDNVLFLNYANPNAMNTWAANLYGDVPTIGLCHGVRGGHRRIAQAIENWINKGKKKGSRGYKEVPLEDVDVICAGINHQTWFIQALYDGRDWTGRMLEMFEAHPQLVKKEPVRIDVLRHFGYFSTESNGHLSEYLPWYRKRPAALRKFIDKGAWGGGETGGYLRHCQEHRNWFKTDFPKMLAEDPIKFGPENRSNEHASWIIEGLELGRLYRGHFNVMNGHTISNLPEDCVVEVPGYVDRNGINIPFVGDLPLGPAAVCNASVTVQRLSVEAAVHGDVELLRQAMLMDPLASAVCTTAEIAQMTDEMLVAQAKWLPQYRHAITAAKKRLRKGPDLGKDWKGTWRKKPRTLTEMRREAAKNSKLVRIGRDDE